MWTRDVHVFYVSFEDPFADEQQPPKTADIMAEPIHIGHIIQKELRSQGRTVTWLAKQLNIHRRACYRIFDCYSIDTQLLLRISELLGRDFFTEYSSILSVKNV